MKVEKKKPAAEEEKNEAAAADAGDESGQADESAKAQEEGDGKDTSGAEDAAEENAEDADAAEEPDAESGNGETADEETEEHPEEADTAEPADNSGGDAAAETDAENGTDKETDPAQRAKALDEREKALLARELRATAIEELAKEQLPSALADCFRYDSEAAFRQSKESVVKAFQGALKEAVDARLRGKPPKTAESAKGSKASGHNFSDIINKNKARR